MWLFHNTSIVNHKQLSNSINCCSKDLKETNMAMQTYNKDNMVAGSQRLNDITTGL